MTEALESIKDSGTDSETETQTKAVIYCRVSSARQVQEGHGLESQATRCREYAQARGYCVVDIFYDRAVSGGLAERPGVMDMLTFLKKTSGDQEIAVIIDDISRLARDTRVHDDLRIAIKLAGGRLESPSIQFGEDSDSILIENLLASVSQHQRQKNAEQVRNRMRARLMNGYWVFAAPFGYRYDKVPGHGKLLVRNEPVASIIQEALEGFASGRFETQSEVKRFLDAQPDFNHNTDQHGKVRFEEIIRLLTRSIYAGCVEKPEWDISIRKGHHEGLITLETFERIQQRIKDGARAASRVDINEDFPLRGFITCGDCDKPLTANWSRSKTGKKYPYYMCFNKGCASYRKSIHRDEIEGGFADLLTELRPSADLFHIFKTMFDDAWNQRLAQLKDLTAALKQEVTGIERKIENLMDRIVDADSTTSVKAYERRIAKLERDKIIKAEKLENGLAPKQTPERMFELALGFLANPCKLWNSDKIEHRRTVLKLVFSTKLAYQRGEGFRTPKTTLPFNMLGEISMRKNAMAERVGFEPTRRFPACWFSRPVPSTTRPPLLSPKRRSV